MSCCLKGRAGTRYPHHTWTGANTHGHIGRPLEQAQTGTLDPGAATPSYTLTGVKGMDTGASTAGQAHVEERQVNMTRSPRGTHR